MAKRTMKGVRGGGRGRNNPFNPFLSLTKRNNEEERPLWFKKERGGEKGNR
jgi:hypothetical protein